ncbi:protein disulfide isomerase [Mycena galopus ATCC 62051]|nr:protein disulfide isomerase [Mycena galopus ATCC 62051]
MRLSTLFAPSLLALVSVVLADDEVPSDVVSLTAATFSSINTEPLILVEFFAPWCGHCKALAPHYEEAATALKEKNIKIAKVDCVDQADLCQSNGIQGYPTLKVYRNGTPTDYTGPRKADGIISYMVKQSLPAVTEVTTANQEEFQKADNLVVIAYLSSPTDAPAPAFSETAEKHRDDFLFGLSTDQAAIDAAKVNPPAVVVYRKFDEPTVVYPFPILDAGVSDLEDWIKELAVPTIAEVSGENYATYAQSSKPLAYLFIDPSLDTKEAEIEKLRPIASKYKSKMNFVWIDAIKFGDHAKGLNLAEVKWPAFVIQNVQKQLKFPYDQSKEVEADGVEAWVKAYLDGELVPQLKSEPIPEAQDENVYYLVGKEFEKVVFDDAKDVFIEFYASWCGHCKRLKPTWDALGDHYAPFKNTLTIAKLEAQENDLPPSLPFSITGFPTIKFKKAGTRDFIDYEGDRSYESLVAFLEEHAVNPIDFKDVPAEEAVVTEDDHAQAPVDAHDEL